MRNSLFNADYILGRSRFAWIDYARGISIILVVFRHVYEGLSNADLGVSTYPWLKYLNVFLFSFRMPLFFIISGLFVSASLQKKSIAQFVEDRFKIILYPLLVWGVLQITIQLIFKDYTNVQREPIDYLNLLLLPRKVEQFWYLNALFGVGVLYAFLKVKVKMKLWQQLLLGIVFYATAYYCNNNLNWQNIKIGFWIDIFEFYLFFAIGDAIARILLKKENFSFFSSWKLFLPLLVLFIFCQHYFTKINLAHNNDYYVAHYQPVLFFIVALIGCAFVISTCFVLEKFTAARSLRVIGFHSLFIYSMHLIVIAAVRVVLVKFFGISNVPLLVLLAILFGIFIPMLTYNICLRLNCWWLFTLKKPDEEIRHIIKPVAA